MDRRRFITTSTAAGALAVFGSLGTGRSARAKVGPYGPLTASNLPRLELPAGFSARVIATTGERVAGTGHVWHRNPDGGATFGLPDGGWVYVSNDESGDFNGGVSMVRFDAGATVVDAKTILSGTNRNCAGGPTPWGTWLSCEEFDGGRVWECDPLGEREAVVRPALGVFAHEAAAADPVRGVLYLTEDKGKGGLYRFTPDRWEDLSSGRLEIATPSPDPLRVVWVEVPDPTGQSRPTRAQVDDAIRFDGGEGAWFDGSHLLFTTKGDNRVWRYDPRTSQLTVVYQPGSGGVLTGVDNVTVSAAGEIFVCEDGGNMEVVLISPFGEVTPFMRLDVGGSELCGAAFDPSGTRMYVSSQRNPGRTYEITGPFTQPRTAAAGGPPVVDFVG